MTTGDRIKEARKAAGITQAQLANKLGISYVGVSQWENNLRNPKHETLKRIASALGVSVGSLLGYEEEKVVIPGRLKIITVNDPELENIQYRIEAEDAEAFNLGCKIMEDAGVSISAHTPAGRISAALGKLNLKGQTVAVERVEELTKIPDYQRRPPQEPPAAPSEGRDTTPAENAATEHPESK